MHLNHAKYPFHYLEPFSLLFMLNLGQAISCTSAMSASAHLLILNLSASDDAANDKVAQLHATEF